MIITYSDDTSVNLGSIIGKNGTNGKDGNDGKDGKDGANGIGISKTEIDTNGNLVITYSDNSVKTVGKIVGADGKDGKDGVNGRDGIDGKDGINGLNGTDGKDGLNGQDGLNGKDGKDGSDGVGIRSVNINSSNELVLVLSDNSEINLGNIKGKDGENGKNGKDGADGVGIKTVTLSTDGNLSIVLTNNTTVELGNIKGEKGNSIKSARINAVGELMITLSDNSELNAGRVTGLNGSDGKGIDTVSLVDGNLTITLTDGTVNNLGNISGKDGTNGLNGKDGKDGRGIVKTEIVNGELIITYTDNTTENAGKVIDDTTGSEGLDFYPLPDGTFGVAAGKTKYLENIVIPETHNGKQVTEILENAFQNSTNLKSITIPKNLKIISKDAFSNCPSIDTVNYNGNITDWLNIEFESSLSNPCNSGAALYLNGELLNELVIPENTAKINNYAFFGCNSITTITLNNQLNIIGDYAFANCSTTSSLNIPDSVRTIGTAIINNSGITKAYVNQTHIWTVRIPSTGAKNGTVNFAKGYNIANDLTRIDKYYTY